MYTDRDYKNKEGAFHECSKKSTKKLVITSLFSALCAVSTMVAFPVGFGYVNAGDMIVLLGAFTLSPVQAIAAAGIGSAMADLLLGYAAYAPATLLIKALMAMLACRLSLGLKRINVPAPIAITLSAVCAELCMVFGYLAYEWTLLVYGSAALTSIPANLTQAAFGCVGGVVFYYIAKNIKITDKLTAF